MGYSVMNCFKNAAGSFVGGLAKICQQQPDLNFSLLSHACVARIIYVAAMQALGRKVDAAQPNKHMSMSRDARA
jgi:hypothetical protein